MGLSLLAIDRCQVLARLTVHWRQVEKRLRTSTPKSGGITSPSLIPQGQLRLAVALTGCDVLVVHPEGFFKGIYSLGVFFLAERNIRNT